MGIRKFYFLLMKAKFLRFCHCLFYRHRGVDVTIQMDICDPKEKDKIVSIGCECGKRWC